MRLSLACLMLVIVALPASAQDAPPPSSDAADTPAPAPVTGSPEERIRLLEERLAKLERPADASTDALTLGSVVTTLSEEIKLTALVSTSYTWNLANPPFHRDANRLRVNDPDHDTFELTYAKLGVYRDPSGENDWDAGFRAEFAAGRQVETTLSLDPEFNGGDELNLAQGYVVLQAPTPLDGPITITFGRFYGWFGIESLDTPTNPNFSLSHFSNFTPFTNTGVGVGFDLVKGLRYTQYVVNGWDLVFDNNDGKSYGGQLTWTLDQPATTLALNWLAGPEQDGDEDDVRWLVELDLITKITQTTEVRAALHYGQEEGAAVGGGVAKYGGAQVVLRQELYEVREGFRRFAVAGRVASWRDQGGSKSGTDQTLVDLTGTFEVRFTEWASARFEWRHDQSNEAFFFDHDGQPTQHHQDTASVELNVRF